jgi:hypothetical protein
LWPQRRPVAATQLKLGAQAWNAFCSPDRIALQQLLTTDLHALPFLGAALARHLEEFPAPPDGLSRTERQILRAVAAGHDRFDTLFHANQAQEAAPYLGDTTFADYIKRLTQCRTPLLTREPIRVTDAGQRVLAGELDARKLNGLDRWLGGVHLKA